MNDFIWCSVEITIEAFEFRFENKFLFYYLWLFFFLYCLFIYFVRFTFHGVCHLKCLSTFYRLFHHLRINSVVTELESVGNFALTTRSICIGGVIIQFNQPLSAFRLHWNLAAHRFPSPASTNVLLNVHIYEWRRNVNTFHSVNSRIL